jgi:hypothetical protein
VVCLRNKSSFHRYFLSLEGINCRSKGTGAKIADMDLFYETPFRQWRVDDIAESFSNYKTIKAIDSCYKQDNAQKLMAELSTKYNQTTILYLVTNCPLHIVMLKDPYFTEVGN